ncbi:MAG: class I poly(R)-hydroxyalkanoic acid synthase, partial [Paracoccus sp. (in: a-proteobacteria)]|nr:class I poly(R)-hydroxyalkanoic acid synthase [Paracoccus sp. (in: a-proteobacteria)]
PAIRNYMLGETPPAFDLLYWNGDSTNLPGRMTLEYLNGLCRQNQLVEGGFEVLGEKVSLKDVTIPLCSVACETDHIAPWKDCWRGFAQIASRNKLFILSESGHIAGIINPPSKKKYGHYLSNAGFDGTWQDWQHDASFHEGSWWPTWGKWVADFAGPMVAARKPGQGLGAAPGTYVHERANG